jgi:hypothetical protein
MTTSAVATMVKRMTSTHTIFCERKMLGCKTSADYVADGIATAATAAQVLYRQGWRVRVKQHEGKAVIYCPNCVYSES